MSHGPRWIFLAYVIALDAAPARCGADQLVLADDRQPHAQLDSINTQWQMRFQTPAGLVAVQPDQLVYWGDGAVDRVGGPIVLLTDGSQLHGRVAALLGESVEIRSPLWQTVVVPRSSIRAILLRPGSDPPLRDELLIGLHAPSATDGLLLDNGDEMAGTITGFAADAENETDIEWTGITGRQQLALSRVVAVRLGKWTHPGSELATEFSPVAEMATGDGSLLVCDQVNFDQQTLHARLACGIQLQADPRVLQDNPQPIVSILSLQAPVTWLSNLVPDEYRYVPWTAGNWDYQMDKNVLGGYLRVRGRVVRRGIGMHSRSSLTFALQRPYRRLDFDLAIDESSGDLGSAVAKVLVLTRDQQWTTAYSSPVIRGGRPATAGSVDLSSIDAIALTIDFADGGDTMDRVNWLRIRLVP